MGYTQKRCRREHAGIVEQDVYATETRNSSSCDAFNSLWTPDVACYVKNVFAGGIYAQCSLRQHILPPAIQHYFGSDLIETTRGVCADACAATCDNNDFVF